jgi:hypothetical protein
MRLPNWLWPKTMNPEPGFAARLGRLLHWLCAISAAVLAIFAAVLAVVAVLSSQATAQNTAANVVQEDKPDPANIVWDAPSDQVSTSIRSQKLPHVHSAAPTAQTADQTDNLAAASAHTSVLGAYSQRDRGSDIPLPNLEAPPKTSAVDWVLLRTAGILFLGSIALMLLGRGIRYILSNE